MFIGFIFRVFFMSDILHDELDLHSTEHRKLHELLQNASLSLAKGYLKAISGLDIRNKMNIPIMLD